MPAVNIAGVNTMFVADPQRRKREEQQQQYMQQQQQQQQQTQPNSGSNRRVRIASRSLSSDNELDSWASCLEEASTEKGAQFSAEDDGAAPKHKRTRVSQQVRQRNFLKIAPIFFISFSLFHHFSAAWGRRSKTQAPLRPRVRPPLHPAGGALRRRRFFGRRLPRAERQGDRGGAQSGAADAGRKAGWVV